MDPHPEAEQRICEGVPLARDAYEVDVLEPRQIVLGRARGALQAAKFLADGWILYLYHPQYLIAHTNKLDGFKPMPDGLLRVTGVKLK